MGRAGNKSVSPLLWPRNVRTERKKCAAFPGGCVVSLPGVVDFAGVEGKAKRAAANKEQDGAHAAFVELITAQQKVFSGRVAAVKFSPVNAVVEIQPSGVSYFGQIGFGELTVRIGTRFEFFTIIRGTASVGNGQLTVGAETIERVASSPRNCGNPMCNCGPALLQASAASLPSKQACADCCAHARACTNGAKPRKQRSRR